MPAPEVIINSATIAQVAAAAAIGSTIPEISSVTGISRHLIKKVMAMPEFKRVVKDIGDEAVNNAKQIIRSKTSELASEVMRVLRERLADNDLEAVKVSLKIIGFDQQEQKQTGDTQINVILPGAEPTAEFVESFPVEDVPNEA